VGATKIEHLETAVKSLDLTLTEDQIQRIETPYLPHSVKGHH
jgi:aryl-alcohol dehydrogenase-like predicted oxidoreductase